MDWDRAWDITRKAFGYTNHTLLPEALERWPLAHVRQAAAAPPARSSTRSTPASWTRRGMRFWGDDARIARLSLIDESGERYVRMANLACVGSHAINGVAELHSELLKQDVLQDFHALWPEKFSNKTNGVTPRRWMVLSNPRLARLITDAIGEELGHRPRPACAARAAGRGRSLPRPLARRQARQQGRVLGLRPRTAPGSRSTPSRCSTCRSSASTSTSGSTSTSCT